ncbi:MAG: hypothetical protein LBG47_03720, partial [Prevotellaceae bacterium]|nr:hypothetical protein [Prevotellaceae bacterium]
PINFLHNPFSFNGEFGAKIILLCNGWRFFLTFMRLMPLHLSGLVKALRRVVRRRQRQYVSVIPSAAEEAERSGANLPPIHRCMGEVVEDFSTSRARASRASVGMTVEGGGRKGAKRGRRDAQIFFVITVTVVVTITVTTSSHSEFIFLTTTQKNW